MKKLFSLLLVLVSLLITLSVSASIVNTPTDEDENYWIELVKNKKKEFSTFKTASEIFLKSFKNEIIEISRFRESLEFKFDQLKLRLITEEFGPYSFRATTREGCLVIEEFTAKYAEANKLLNIISGYIDTFEQIKISIDTLLSKKMPTDVKVSLEGMRSDVAYICDHISKIQCKLNSELIIFDRLKKAINASLPKFKYIITKHIIKWYLMPSINMYHTDVLRVFGVILYEDWFHSFYYNVIQGVPDFQNERSLLIISFLCGIFTFLLGWFFLHKFLKKEEARRKMFVKSLFWAAIGFIVFVYTGLIDFYPRIHFNYFLISIFFIISVMYLSWGFRCKEYVPEKNSPFEPMLWLFIYGMILQFMDIYYPVLSVLWLVGIIINIFYLKKQISKNYLVFEKVLLVISSVLYICCILMILIGLVYLSILVLLSWFIICLSIQLGFNVNVSARKIIEYFAGGAHSLIKIIIIGIIAPVVWLLMIVFLYLWIVRQIFGSELLFVDLPSINIHGADIPLNYVILGFYLFFAFRAISNMTKITIRKLVSTSKIESGAAPSISLLVSYVLWGLYFVVILYLMGANLTHLVVVAGGLSVGLGFGLRDIVNNFFSSLIILLGRSVRHGDIIEIDGMVGKVLEITIRSTIVQTKNNAIVAIPNSEIISSKLINWTGNDSAVMKEIKIGVSYDSDTEKVKYILLDIAKSTEHVLRDPSPSVVFDEFADSTLNFVLNIWADDIRTAPLITSLIREKINTEFKANGIKMAYPQLDVHLNEDKAKI